jgi:glycosyltransferase involved in cell wall biosynthesis
MFNNGAFGGAPKRYTLLYRELLLQYPDNIFLIVNNHLYRQIKSIFPELDTKNVIVIDYNNDSAGSEEKENTTFYSDHSPDPVVIDKKTSLLRKIYWYYKNLYKQKSIYKKIEAIRIKYNIKVFTGVFSGSLPTVFYLKDKKRRVSLIFANMDSWFSEVHRDMKLLWYRKYYSFNYIMENADFVDFLSPYILEGVKQRNVQMKPEAISIAPCSFADYSKCKVGDKSQIEVAFSARLEPDKNPLMFLEAAATLHKKYPGIKFHLMGEGSLVFEIEKFIKESGLSEAVNFKFHKNPPEVFANTGIIVSLQTGTNYPSQTLLEAMACANAVVASNTGDTKLFISENNGLLIVLDANELVKALEELINNPTRLHQMGNNARELVLTSHTAEKYCEYFISLVQKAYNKNFA